MLQLFHFQTEEQIRKLTTQQDLDELKRIQFILTKGQLIQKISLFQNLNQLLMMYPSISHLFISVIRNHLQTQDIEIQSIIGKQFKKFFQHNIKLQEKQFSEIVDLIMIMLQCWNQNVTEHWVQAFGSLVQHKQFPLYQKKILQLITRLSDIKQVLPIRIIAVKAISYLANIMKNRIKGVLLQRIRYFCRDPQKQLRLIIMKQVMPRLFKNLSNDVVGAYFSQKLFEMAYDKQFAVKIATIQVIFTNCEIFSHQQKQSRLLNILIQNLESDNQQVMIVLSKLLGEIYIKLKVYLEKNTKVYSLYLNSIVKYSKCINSSVRLNFIYNLPGLVYYLNQKIWNDVKQIYIQILLSDKDKDVRHLSLLIFHQMIQICEVKNFKNYPIVLLNILQNFNNQSDENRKKQLLSIYSGLFQNIDSIIISIQQQINLLELKSHKTQTLQNILHKILLNLIKIMKSASYHNKNNLLQKILQRIYKILKYINLDLLLLQYVPILFNELKKNNKLVTKQVINNLSAVLTLLIRKKDSERIVKELECQFLNTNVSFKNIIYIKISRQLLDCFSFQKYRSCHFLENCLRLSIKKQFTIILQLIQYIQSLIRLYSLTQKEIQQINRIISMFKDHPQPLVHESLSKIEILNSLTEQEKQYNSLFRQIKNQQRISNQQGSTKQTDKFYKTLKIQQNIILYSKFNDEIKKNVTCKTKKQNTLSKYASRLKAKINISLSTNALNSQNQLNLKDRIIKQQQKLFINYLAEKNKQYESIGINDLTKQKKISLFLRPEEQIRIKRKKKPSIQLKNIKQLLTQDIDKRCSLQLTKRRKNVTQKKI